MRLLAQLVAVVLIAAPVSGQFGPQQVITATANGATSVFAADLDGDEDADVLSASSWDNTIAWYENNGSGSFGPRQVITATAGGASSVFASDLDGDGDFDVLSASSLDGKFAWYENLGGGSFGPEQLLSASIGGGARSVLATDLDGDGDADVLAASDGIIDSIAWYENLENGTGVASFGGRQVITNSPDNPSSVYAADLDGDGNSDVLSAWYTGDKIAWYENLGGGSFGLQQVITLVADKATSVYAADLDGDGDQDVLSSSENDDMIAWYENLGGGDFGLNPFDPPANQQVITTSADGAKHVYATDMDGDGDVDVLSASCFDDKVAWYENLGGGSFGPQQVITTQADLAGSVFAVDLDGDAMADVLSSSFADDTVAWYENLQLDCNGNGVSDAADISNGTSLDSNADGIPDECQGTWLDLGNALGPAQLSGSGPLLPGGPISLSLSNTLQFSNCYLVLGFLNLGAPFKAGVLVPVPDVVVPLFSDGLGGVFLAVTWPGGVPPGFSIYMQYWIPDAAGPAGFSASNALSATTP